MALRLILAQATSLQWNHCCDSKDWSKVQRLGEPTFQWQGSTPHGGLMGFDTTTSLAEPSTAPTQLAWHEINVFYSCEHVWKIVYNFFYKKELIRTWGSKSPNSKKTFKKISRLQFSGAKKSSNCWAIIKIWNTLKIPISCKFWAKSLPKKHKNTNW